MIRISILCGIHAAAILAKFIVSKGNPPWSHWHSVCAPALWMKSAAVSYTHLDVYKRQGQHAVIQHQDVVGALHAGCTLGDDEYRHAFGLFFNSLAQGSIGGKVQCRGTVVQNQNLRLRHQRAGNR